MNRFRANSKLLAPLIAGLAMVGPFTIDTIFPAFRAIESEFGIPAISMQQTVSVYLAAFAGMSLVHGPLSDAFGRRGVILIALGIFALSSVGCGLAPNLPALLMFRALQGISAGAGIIIGRAIVRDLFDGADAQRLMSQVTLIFGIAPAVAPIVGGWLLDLWSWRSIFWFLTGFTLLLFTLSLVALPETLPRHRRVPLSPRQLLRTYRAIGGDRRFMLLGVSASLNFGALFIYISSAPVIVLDLLHLNTRQFAYLFIPVIGGMMGGARLSGMLAGRMNAAKTLRLGYLMLGVGSLLDIAVSSLFPPAAPWSILPVTLCGIGVSLSFPTLTLLMLDRFPAVRGAAASVQAAMGLGFNALASGVISPLVSVSLPELALAAGAVWLCSFLCWVAYRRLTPDPRPTVLIEERQSIAVPNAPAPDH